MNFFQQFGLAGFAGGIVLMVIRSMGEGTARNPLASFSVGGGVVGVVLPPDWVIGALLMGGLVMLVLGTFLRVVHRRQQSESAAD